jgi:hypothetical protein
MAGLGLQLAGSGMKAVGGLFGMFQGNKLLKEAKKINPLYEKYQTSGAAKAMAGMAQTNLNAVNPLFAAQQRQIAGSQANAMAGLNRGAMDASQLIAGAAGMQAQSDQASFNLGMQEMANRNQNMQNWIQAQNILLGEDRTKYQDMLNKYQLDLNQKNLMRTAGMNAIAGGAGQIGAGLTQSGTLINDAAGKLFNAMGGKIN